MVDEVRIPLAYSDMPSHTLFARDPPSVIYHYTDYTGASGIIESKSLWLTKLSYLNDRTELRLAIDLFRDAANNVAQEIGDEEKRVFLGSAVQQIQSFQSTNICVGSFCESGDLLSQWRSYGNGGKGVALEFDAQSLKRLSNTGLMNLWRCIYTPSEHRALARELVEILVNSYDVIAQNKSANKNWEQTKKDLLGYFNTTFLQVAPVIKNSHFNEEKEWRLITVPRPYTDSNYFARIGNSRVSQHYRLDFHLIDNGLYEFLEGVIIGPTSDPESVSSAFWVLLSKNNYKYKRVGYSQIPYRHNQ